jgi:UDP-glucose 4-epimerase
VNAPTRVAVVGSGSLVAGALRQHPQAASWDYIAHDRALADCDWLEGVGLVINCAIDPRLKTSAYDVAFDVDVRLAQLLSPHTRYVMLSSRLAYGPAGPDMRLVEQCQPKPDRPYGINKLTTERALTALLGDRLTVLRLSNVFGAEDRPGRQSFFAQALRKLRSEGRIVLDMSPFVERDFIPAEEVAQALFQVARAPRPGLFNLGAGRGVATGRIAQWLIEGYGEGHLEVQSLREFDAFWLDMEAAGRAFRIAPVPVSRIRDRCRQLGAQLARAQEAAA